MSIILLGVLRMPPSCWGAGEIDVAQRHAIYCEAADEIEAHGHRCADDGVSDKTVAKYRAEMESTSEIPKLKSTVGRDGKKRHKPH